MCSWFAGGGGAGPLLGRAGGRQHGQLGLEQRRCGLCLPVRTRSAAAAWVEYAGHIHRNACLILIGIQVCEQHLHSLAGQCGLGQFVTEECVERPSPIYGIPTNRCVLGGHA